MRGTLYESPENHRKELIHIHRDLDFIMNEMKYFHKPWFISGGWAIDIGLGQVTREHKDIDICVFREDADLILDYFKAWDINVAIPGEHRLEKCTSKAATELPRYCFHLFRDKDFVEILLTERLEGKVIFRKNRNIWMNESDFSLIDNQGRPYVNPVWQLLFKGINPRKEDDHDFNTYLPIMSDEQRVWLSNGLKLMKPESMWIKELII